MRTGLLTHSLLGALALTSLTGIACAPLIRSQKPNAVGVQFIRGHGGPECEVPQGEYFDPARVCAPQLQLHSENGVAASYGRHLWGISRKEGMNLRIGPELVAARVSGRSLSAPQATYPAKVSEWFAAGLLRFDFHNEGPTNRIREQVFNRMDFTIGGGLAFAGFREGDVLIDGTANLNRKTDVVVGPAIGLGLGYWITKDLILRGDAYGAFAKPELSFVWKGYASFAGIGLVKTF